MSTVDHPKHYNAGRIEVIDAIEDWSPSWPDAVAFHLGNAIKYVARAGKKDDTVQDLKKAVWYLNRAIEKLEQKP